MLGQNGTSPILAHPFRSATSAHHSMAASGNPRTLAINLPCSSLERDFRRRRLAHQNGPEDDVSAQRPAIGDHHQPFVRHGLIDIERIKLDSPTNAAGPFGCKERGAKPRM